jgi:hypothetical protein
MARPRCAPSSTRKVALPRSGIGHLRQFNIGGLTDGAPEFDEDGGNRPQTFDAAKDFLRDFVIRDPDLSTRPAFDTTWAVRWAIWNSRTRGATQATMITRICGVGLAEPSIPRPSTRLRQTTGQLPPLCIAVCSPRLGVQRFTSGPCCSTLSKPRDKLLAPPQLNVAAI